MSKRQSTSQLHKNHHKKSKLDHSDDEIWGEDVNPKVFEECIEQATQITPTYTQFLAQHQSENGIFSSTPAQDPRLFRSDLHWRNKNLNLTQENVIKNGEIAILRNQIKQLQIQLNTERSNKFRIMERKQGEWLNKINDLIKEKNSLQTEVEFKTLEMINLRHKINEMKHKAKHPRQSTSQSAFPRSKSSSFVDDNLARNKKSSKAVQADFVTNVTFERCRHKVLLNDLKIRFELPLSIFSQLNSNTVISKTEFKLTQAKTSIFGSSQCSESGTQSFSSAGWLYNDLLLLMLCKKKETDQEYIDSVKNIFEISLYILVEFEEFLNNSIEDSNMSCPSYQSRSFCWKFSHFNHKQLLELPDFFNCRACVDYEFGIVPRLFLTIITRLLSCSTLIWDMINDKIANFLYNCLERNENFIDLILILVYQIEKSNRGDQLSGFLASVLIFLKKYIEMTSIKTYFKEINYIIRIIIVTKPNLVVFYYLIDYINRCAIHKSLAESFCQNSNTSCVIDLDNHRMFFNFDSCLMQILVKYIDIALDDLNPTYIDDKIKERMFENILQTCHNFLRRNLVWTRKDANCKCVKKIYLLTIRLIYEILIETHFKLTKDLLRISIFLLYEMIIVRPASLIGRNLGLHGLYNGSLAVLKIIKHSLDLNPLEKSCLDEILEENSFIPYWGVFVIESPQSCKLWNEIFDNVIPNENLEKKIVNN